MSFSAAIQFVLDCACRCHCPPRALAALFHGVILDPAAWTSGRIEPNRSTALFFCASDEGVGAVYLLTTFPRVL